MRGVGVGEASVDFDESNCFLFSEDFRLDEPLGICLMAVQCLSPGVWDSVNHLSTSAKPKEAKIAPHILDAGIRNVGCYEMYDEEWDAALPQEFFRFMRTFDLRTADRGNGRVKTMVSGMTDAIPSLRQA